MDLTFRLPGPWGAGKGANLQPTEVDNNFWSLAEAIVDLQSNPAQPVGIASISVSGTQMTITLTDGSTMGPFTLPVLTFRWRGEWVPLAAYAELDVFTVLDTGIFMALLDHTSGATFDPDIAVGGEPALQQLFGSTNAALNGLSDVEISEGGPNNGDVLIWNEDVWLNVHQGSMGFQDNWAVNITGGAITGMPSPVNPSDVVNKAYVDALPGGMSVANATMMSNIAGISGPALPNTLTNFLDYVLLTSARGTMLYRGSTGWVALPPGTSGYFLKTLGAGADPAWALGGSGVTSVAAGAGITTGAGPITATGSVALASVADNSLLANITGTSAAPAAATLTTFLDHVASSTRGAILTRAGSGWVALAPGVNGYYLQTQGSTADPVWSAPSGSGTVTSISAGTGISTGGAPITGAGTVSLAAIATASVLANISGSTAAPVPATVSVLFDSVFGSTQGAVLYRNASTWVMLAPGTSGQVLTTGGASANPAWANAAAGAPIANLLLLSNISGGTAAPSGNSLSNIFDSILGSSRGMLVYRGSAGWVALSPGTSGDVLTTGGAAGDPHWAATAAGGASISVGDTAPSSPSPGDAWWDSVAGQLYIRYNDGTSSQWVPASNQPGPPGPGGTVTSISAGAGITVTPNPIVGTGSVALTVPVGIANGGTGSTTALAALAALGGAPLASPVFTGDPRAPTPLTADSDTSIATTAYVQAQGYATSAAMTTADNLRVLKAGDTMSGALTVQNLITSTGAAAGLSLEGRNTAGVYWGFYSSGNVLHITGVGGTDIITANAANLISPGILNGTSVRITGNYLYLANATGPFNGAGVFGPLIYGDSNYIIARALSGFFLKNDADVSVLSVDSGSFNIAGATATKPGGGPFTAPSSVELKSDIAPYPRGLAEILQLSPVLYSYNGTGGLPKDQRFTGLNAEDLQPVMPECVVPLSLDVPGHDRTGEDPQAIETLGVDTGPLVMAMLNAIKELAAKVAVLEGKPA